MDLGVGGKLVKDSSADADDGLVLDNILASVTGCVMTCSDLPRAITPCSKLDQLYGTSSLPLCQNLYESRGNPIISARLQPQGLEGGIRLWHRSCRY
jgi:hypothetical protein